MPDLRKQTNPNAYLGTNDLLRRLDAAIRERDEALAEAARLRVALTEIAGWFIKDQRNTYLPGDEVLDRIRVTAEDASGPIGCPCVGTPEEDDCPHA